METKSRWPELFAETVEIDVRMRDGPAFAKEPYLHSFRMPLAWAAPIPDGWRDGSRNECEWRCGIGEHTGEPVRFVYGP